MIDELSESAPQAAAALQAIKDAINGLQSTGGFDIEAEIQKFDNLYGAMKNSVSGTGLKSQDIENVKAMFSGLKGYDPSVLFERTEHGIHLNTTALRALQSEYESTKKLDIQNELKDLKQQYNDTKTELEGLTKGTDEYNQKMAQLTGIENQINDVQTLAAQYEGLTSAYNKWIMAQSAGEEGDMYDSITNSLEDIKKLYDDGLIGTNAFRAAVQMMTDEDLSTASIDKLIATYEAGYPAMERYFTKGHDGALTFLEDVQSINTEWAKQNEDGSWDINFGIGNDAEIAQAISDMTGLKVSTEEVQMIMRKLSDYGFDIKLDSAYTSIDELKSRIEESEEKLKELGQEPVDIDVNVELDDIDSEIEKAQQLIQEINDSDIDPDVKTAQLEDANNKLDVLISKKLEATEPAFMQLSTSDVDSGLASTLTLLQQFQNAVEQEYICTVKGDTAGVEEAHTKVESLAQEIAALDSDTLAEIGITVDTSNAESTVSSVKSSIETGNVSFGVDVDTSGVESAKTTIDSVDGKDVEVTVTADNTALDNLKTALDSLQDKTITVTANTVGTENVDTLKTSTDALIDKTVTATANAVGKENVDALKQSIDSLYDRTVTSTAKVVGTNLVIALKAAIDALYNKTVSVGANVFGTAAVQGLRSAIDSLYSKTVTATTVTRTVAGVDGTAHANGTAFAQGDWGTKDSGVALGGELGQEIVVRNGHFFTIGDNGAEFFKYKKGDIIFNAEQSKQILEKGKITHGNGRGKALAEGTAFSSGSGRFTSGGQTVYNSSGSGSGKSGGNSNGGKSSSSSSSTKDFKETFDWIEVAIDRIERAIDKLDKKASSTYRSWSERNKSLSSEMGKVSDEIALQQAGYTRYMQQANSVGLSTEWMNKVKNGLVDINTITDEGLAEKLKEAQEWIDKAKDCEDAVVDLQEKLSELYKVAFENVSAQYEGILGVIKHEQGMIEEYISQAENKGYLVSTQYYEALMAQEQKNIAELQKQKADQLQKLNEAVASGNIKAYSEEWYAMCNAVDETTLAIEQGTTALTEYAKAIQQIKWEMFDLLQEKISAVTTEANFMIDLLSSADMFNDKGQMTSEGQSTMGLHAVNYNVYMSQADQYAQEMMAIDKQLADDPANEELAKRRQELLELQQDMIIAAEDEKKAIVDMVREGIELELDSLKDLIDTYKDAIDAQKDLYSWQNKIKDQTSEIATLQKQLQAYSGDTSEETKATVQKIKVSLEKAQSNLEESEYDKYISDQKALLDELYLDYETVLNMRLDNIDSLIADMIHAVNDNSSEIASTLYNATEKVGYTMSTAMNDIWQQAYANTQSESALRVQQMTTVLNQLVKNGSITQYEADQLLAALGNGDAKQAAEVLSMIQQMVNNGAITTNTGNSIISSLNTNSVKATNDSLKVIQQLVANGTLSQADANKIVTALVTGTSADKTNAANIISRLLANNTIDTSNAANLLTALNGNTVADNTNSLNIINRLLQNANLSTADATKLWNALITGNSQDLANTTGIITRLLTNSQISSQEAAQLIASMNGQKAADLQNALSIVNKLTQNGTLSQADANKIVTALVTGDAGAVANANSIISKLEAQGKISTADATALKNALTTSLTNAQGANTNIVTTYGKDLGSKLTTVNTSLSNIKNSVDAILAKMNKEAEAKTQTPTSSTTNPQTTPKPTTTPTTTPTPTPTPKPTTPSTPTRTKKEKYGVALAIWNGNYGWGTGDTRKKRLEAKGFNYNEVQGIVNQMGKDGYVYSGAWVGKYEGIKDLSPYHYNKFAQGVHKLNRNQLALTQEKGTEFINSPSQGMLTPLTKGTDVFNASASQNLWDMANNPEQFLQDNLGLRDTISGVPISTGGNSSNVTVNFENITLPNVKNYEDFMNTMMRDKKFESAIRSMTTDCMFGKTDLRKFNHKW